MMRIIVRRRREVKRRKERERKDRQWEERRKERRGRKRGKKQMRINKVKKDCLLHSEIGQESQGKWCEDKTRHQRQRCQSHLGGVKTPAG